MRPQVERALRKEEPTGRHAQTLHFTVRSERDEMYGQLGGCEPGEDESSVLS